MKTNAQEIDTEGRLAGIMKEATKIGKKWWIKGLLFENCNCQIVCQGHVSYRQLCNYEQCIGHWAIHIEEGQFGNVIFNNLNVIILYITPQLMSNGGWTETIYIDEKANEVQRLAIERILMGQEGVPG